MKSFLPVWKQSPWCNLVLMFVACLVTSSASSAFAQAPPLFGDWVLTFEDEFDGAVLDNAKWKMGQHWSGINGAAGNAADNITVSGGKLIFKAEKRSFTYSGQSFGYATGEISSFKRFRQRYGYFEARLRYDATRGVWPAFWLMPDRGNYGNLSENTISYLKFDLSSDARTAVDSAILRLHVVDADGSGRQNIVALDVLDDSWAESTITWNQQPQVDPIMIAQAYNPMLVAGDELTLNITANVNEALAGDKVVSLSLIDGFMRVVGVTFGSREQGDPNDRPRLELTQSGNTNTVTPVADAAVRHGTHADSNFGGVATLRVREDWRDTSSTFNGGMEIDIQESLGIWGDHWNSHALHWDGYGASHQSIGSGKFSFPVTPDGFHKYGLYWQPGLIRCYVDDVQTFEHSDPRVASIAAYILLSFQMGGWDNNWPADDAALPAEMQIDYVRVWSGSACSTVAGDVSGDLAVQADDFTLLLSSMSGPGQLPISTNCADLDRDGDADLGDLSDLMLAIGS
jgi:beta-glucanase (GH16 family)